MEGELIYGDVEAIEHMEAEAADDGQPNNASASYDEMKEREKNGGAPLEFDPAMADICSTYIGTGFSVMERRKGPHWAIGDDERRQLGIATAQVIHYYFPKNNLGPLGNLTVVSATILGPRVLMDIMIKREKQAMERQALAQKKDDSDGEQDQDEQPDQ